MKNYFPLSDWLVGYSRKDAMADLPASLIVTVLLIPQSLAYAMLAGLPAEHGLYASILPLVAYALLGTSRTLSVGTVAVTSLMTAAMISRYAEAGSADYVAMAIALAGMSGVILLLLGINIDGHTLPEMMVSLSANAGGRHSTTVFIGISSCQLFEAIK